MSDLSERATGTGQLDRVAAIVLVVLLGGALAALSWLGRDIPVDYDCGEEAPPGNDLDGFRCGAPFAHALAALLLLGAIVALSWRRNRRRGIDRPGEPTVYAAAVAALVTLVAAVSEDVGVWVIAVVSLITPAIARRPLARHRSRRLPRPRGFRWPSLLGRPRVERPRRRSRMILPAGASAGKL